MKTVISILSIFVGFICGTKANAYPEMVRHAYVNCTTCHVSPTGSGLMTSYGRSLSKEILSTWGRPHEEDLLHGLVKQESLPEWLLVGGNFRAVQTHRETPRTREGQFIRMQADVEAAVRVGKITLDSTLGVIERPGQDSTFGSRRYFALYQATDEAAIRVGRFFPAFGINTADHFISVRRGLGFDQGQESNNVELSWLGETWNYFLTASVSPGEIPETSRERAVSGQAWYSFLESYKVGASYWNGSSDQFNRQIAGAHGILGFSKRFYLLTETDLQWLDSQGTSTRGLFNYQRIGYEVVQGFHVLGIYEYSQRDLNNFRTARDGIGPGLLWYPRPHFEFSLVWQKVRARANGSAFDDFAYLLLHYYL